MIDCRWFYAYAGRDWLRGPKSWGIGFALFPRRDLMVGGDEGRRTLAALAGCVGFWIGHNGGFRLWREAWSDVDEITTRVARRAGVAI